MTDLSEQPTACGYAALIGAPNAGKSTLLNGLVGSKIAIVTHKVQTTRMRITAIALEGAAQIIFLDTPGIFAPRRRLDRAMVEAAWSGAGDADVAVLLVDARKGITGEVEAILKGLAEISRPVWLAINKIDLVKKEQLLALSGMLAARYDFARTYMISALTGDGLDDLKTDLAAAMPAGPWLYPEDQIADLPQRLLAAEITREKIFLRLHKELPYASTVETESWKVQKNGSIRIDQVIYVERDSQKMIVLGKQGRTIKELGRLAREELSEILDTPVHLFLFVKVRGKWGDDPERYRELGLDFPK
ncbi:MAG: GTPase Era [Hyphomicrobiales bacterium]|nr:MAG: GTPase Era [Hyphomicrobiales bacterium]